MKKIKKWQIVVLIILGIGGFWLFQNLWIFEKKVSIGSYKTNLETSEWIDSDNIKWKFDKGILIQSKGDSRGTANYTLNGNELIIEREGVKSLLKMRIIAFRQSTIILKPESPSTNGNSSIYINLKNEK